MKLGLGHLGSKATSQIAKFHLKPTKQFVVLSLSRLTNPLSYSVAFEFSAIQTITTVLSSILRLNCQYYRVFSLINPLRPILTSTTLFIFLNRPALVLTNVIFALF